MIAVLKTFLIISEKILQITDAASVITVLLRFERLRCVSLEILIETLEEARRNSENFLINLLRGEKVKESVLLFKHFSSQNFSTSEIKGVLAVQFLKENIEASGREII
jgi:hypothetical protein